MIVEGCSTVGDSCCGVTDAGKGGVTSGKIARTGRLSKVDTTECIDVVGNVGGGTTGVVEVGGDGTTVSVEGVAVLCLLVNLWLLGQLG